MPTSAIDRYAAKSIARCEAPKSSDAALIGASHSLAVILVALTRDYYLSLYLSSRCTSSCTSRQSYLSSHCTKNDSYSVRHPPYSTDNFPSDFQHRCSAIQTTTSHTRSQCVESVQTQFQHFCTALRKRSQSCAPIKSS